MQIFRMCSLEECVHTHARTHTRARARAHTHTHTPDAIKSMEIFNLYCRSQHNTEEIARLHQLLMNKPVAPSFAKLNPEYEVFYIYI